jgi:DNA-directed RNA polymerase I subunit RPA1
MAHLVRVLPGEMTIRLHYANCKAYNADFDGDEMNIHFPQNELSRSEAYHLVSTHHQYLVPKDGTPLSGLIQDHIVAGVLLTIRGRFFTREDYHKLLFSALPSFTKSFCLLPPSIIKPDRLWSGKQIISTLLLNLIPKNQDKLNLTSKSKISTKEWNRKCKGNNITSPSDTIMTESEVVFRNGQLVCGVLDKSQFGASQFGFVHSCFELYGGEMCNLLLSALGRLFTSFLQLHSFTLGVEDILVTPQADNERTRIINHSRGIGNEAAAEAFAVKDPNNYDHIRDKYEEVHRNLEDNGLKILDYFMKKKTDQVNNRINSVCVPAGLYKPFPDNSLQLMVQAGAKGSTVNCMQISCLLGQIELEGQRPPLMLSGKSLPSFLPYDTSPRAGGFVDGRFLTGIKPQEYVFHCMAGREGLIDTAIKTSRSGYLQRCLIKHLEGITVQYDLSVRDSDGSIIQFLYGEDGLDINKTRFLVPQQLHFMGENYKAMLYQLDPQSAVDALESVKALKYQRKVDRCMKKSNEFPRPRRGGFLDFYEHHLPEFAAKYPNDRRFLEFNNRTKAQRDVIDSWYSSSPMLRNQFTTTQNKSYPPTLSVYRPDRHFGSISEKLNRHVNQYISDNLQQISNNSITKDKFKSLMQFKCLRALADPGEAVGLLAAQSIGEPSTQMTLNTFHFAGRGDMNVTLGIPRLR